MGEQKKNDATDEFAHLFNPTFHFHVWGNKHHLSADDQPEPGPVHPPICDLQNGGQNLRDFVPSPCPVGGGGNDECSETSPGGISFLLKLSSCCLVLLLMLQPGFNPKAQDCSIS